LLSSNLYTILLILLHQQARRWSSLQSLQHCRIKIKLLCTFFKGFHFFPMFYFCQLQMIACASICALYTPVVIGLFRLTGLGTGDWGLGTGDWGLGTGD
jgi:hypothetical protein